MLFIDAASLLFLHIIVLDYPLSCTILLHNMDNKLIIVDSHQGTLSLWLQHEKLQQPVIATVYCAYCFTVGMQIMF